MKKRSFILVLLCFLVLPLLSAQSTTAASIRGMTLNGSTGLIIVPDARISWDAAKVGFDVGYGFVWAGQGTFDNVPRFAVSILGRGEVSGLIQFDEFGMKNFVIGGKFQILDDGSAAMAIGGDYEFVNDNFSFAGDSAKAYLALTYGGMFFTMPAVTTATIGWQLLERGDFSSQFIYGMGFSMSLFPNTFKNYVYWITDFANFSYVNVGDVVGAASRGAFNTGVRIHAIQGDRFKLLVDVIGTDLLDDGSRGLSLTVSGGAGF